MSRKILYFLVVITAVLTMLAACQASEEAAKPAEMVDVSLRLPWIINAQAAGPFTALEKGFFEEENLNVTINAGGPDANSIVLVAAGTDDFGLHDTGSLILARSEGLPLVSVATFWQKHPGCVFALEESGITTLEDFEGKRLGFKEGGPWILTQAMLNAAGVDLDAIEKISVGFGIAPIMEGDVDLLTAFCTNEPLATAREGKPAVTFLPYDYGIETSAEALFTTDNYLNENPEVAAAMVRAIRRGWDYALENKEEAIDFVIKYGGEELDAAQQLEQLEVQESFVLTPDAEEHGIGYMTEERWQIAKDTLVDQGMLDEDVDVQDVFTLEYVQ